MWWVWAAELVGCCPRQTLPGRSAPLGVWSPTELELNWSQLKHEKIVNCNEIVCTNYTKSLNSDESISANVASQN